MEEIMLHDLGKGLTYPDKATALAHALQTPVKGFACPSRRTDLSLFSLAQPMPVNANPASGKVPSVTRSDYAANAGDQSNNELGSGPQFSDRDKPFPLINPDFVQDPSRVPFYATGVSFRFSIIRLKDVVDGLSHTYMVGEKYLSTNVYNSGLANGDNEWSWVGYDNDLYRTSNALPSQDHPTPSNDPSDGQGSFFWGSAHSQAFNMVFCDGSVHQVPYTIDLKLHQNLGNRMDRRATVLDF
jgi:prepilin-type processing-associated H-X9-DG protein